MVESKAALADLNMKEVGFDPSVKLYVELQLTPFMSTMAYKCRCLKRQNLILGTKVQKGVVKILTSHNSLHKWYIITNENDIITYVPGYEPEVQQ